ncbi:type IV pilin protein [Pseudoduganella sp. RAF19]|uniref:type IV pilin protein n=1 Tax=Pseudoduganella sp. RAF19 TaxID=3233052 RepID=UPI003F99BAD1
MNAAERGLSLLETLVAVAIFALLAAVAMPVFTDAMIAARRAEAQGVMEELMQQQERYFTQANTYIAFNAGSATGEAKQFRWWSGRSPPGSGYELEGKACDNDDIANCIQLIAKPGTALVDNHFKDPQCEQLTLTSTGQRTASGPAASRCWK